MKLKDLINQWADKNPGWLVVGIWLLCSLMFYIAVSVGTYLMVVLTASFGWLFFVGCALSGCALGVWHICKTPKLKIWQWGALFLGGALVLSVAIYLLGCLGLFIMSSPISSLICSLIGGGVITGATYLNTIKKKK